MPKPTFHGLTQLPPPILCQLIRCGDYVSHTNSFGQCHL